MNSKIVLTILLILLLVLASQVDLQAQALIELLVETLAWSPNGELIAIGGGEYGCIPEQVSKTTVIVMDLATQEIVNSLQGHECNVTSLAWSPDSTKLAISTLSRSTQIWDVSKDTIVSTAPSAGGFGRSHPIWSPDGTKIVDIWTEHFVFEVWDAETGESLQIFGLDPKYATNKVLSVDWSPDGTQIVSGGRFTAQSSDSFVRIWDFKTGALINDIKQLGVVTSVDWNPTNFLIASGGRDNEIYIWDTESDEVTQTLDVNVDRLEWSPTGDLLAIANGNNQVSVWDIATGEQKELYLTEVNVPSIDWSPAGGRIVFNTQEDVELGQKSNLNALEFIVPVPTLERLEFIKQYCVPTAVQSNLPSVENREVLPDFLDEIKALPEDTISPACTADLIAVAEALLAEEE
jgi:WD40 repeat protein